MRSPSGADDEGAEEHRRTTESLPPQPELPSEPQPAPRSRSRSMSALSGIERFTLLKKLGQGGMGSVYAAYDGVLDRKVAVKIVRPDRRNAGGPVTPRDQLLREAQAMARLSHPNVVAVHEVGEVGDDIYVVLEFVDGTTLWEWKRERSRSWREVVAAYIQAGQGLAAAHDAGLVHRDFKPNNVMIGRDGRIQVGDFGVVSMGGSTSDASLPDGTPSVTPTGEITYAGRRVGTPAYMAPEQYAGASVDARADQFSFCVALWEALYGVRPFAGRGDEVQIAIHDGQIQPPPAGARVPRWIEAPLRRGLAANAADRWPSMEVLLAELARDPAAVRRRRWTVAAVGAGVTAIAIVAWLGWTRGSAASEPCTGAEVHLVDRWDGARATTLRAAFAASRVPYATTAATRVIAQLDGWAPGWVAMRTDACRATRVLGEQSEALLDARMHCLDRQLDEVTQLVDALVTSDREVIARAGEHLALPDVSACADRDVVIARVPPPGTATARERVARIEHELAGIRAAERTGRYHDARVRAAAIAAEATAVGFAPLAAEALLVRGQLEEQDGDLVAARETLTAAAQLAGSAHDDATLARAVVTLAGVLVARAEIPAALALGIAAAAVVARVGDPRLDAQLAEHLGVAHHAAGDGEAEVHLRRALALREATSGADSVPVAQVLDRLAGLDARRGRTSEARVGYERALRIVTAQLGPEHPATAITRANLCHLDAEAGKLEEARACGEQVLGVLEEALGREHPQVAWALNEVALVQREQGDRTGAEQRFERALVIWEHASGTTHPDVAWPLINLGELAHERGELAHAEALCRRALDTIERTSGSSAPDTAPALACLAEALVSHAPRDAVSMARRASEVLQTHGGAPDPAVAFTLARGLAAIGESGEAIATARAALAAAPGELRSRITAWLRTHAARR